MTDSGNSAFPGTLASSGAAGSCSESSSSSSLNNLTVGKASAQALVLTKKRLELNDSEDDLNDESVNLVALDEVASGQYSKFYAPFLSLMRDVISKQNIYIFVFLAIMTLFIYRTRSG